MKERKETFGTCVCVPLGRVVATPGALDALKRSGLNPAEVLLRHQSGDWGDVCEEDRDENDRALRTGDRLLSAYVLPHSNLKVWIISEHDRSVTTLLLPSEY